MYYTCSPRLFNEVKAQKAQLLLSTFTDTYTMVKNHSKMSQSIQQNDTFLLVRNAVNTRGL